MQSARNVLKSVGKSLDQTVSKELHIESMINDRTVYITAKQHQSLANLLICCDLFENRNHVTRHFFHT